MKNISFISLSLKYFKSSSPFVFQQNNDIKCSLITVDRMFSSFLWSNKFLIHRSSFNNMLSSSIVVKNANSYVNMDYKTILTLISPSSCSILHCSFSNCKNIDLIGGGALSIGDPHNMLMIGYSSFVDCVSVPVSSKGGGIYVSQSTGNTAILSCCFRSCSSGLEGNAFFVESPSLEVNSSSIFKCDGLYPETIGSSSFKSDLLEINVYNSTGNKLPSSPGFLVHSSQKSYGNFFVISDCTITESFVFSIVSQTDDKNQSLFQGRYWNIVDNKNGENPNYKGIGEILQFNAIFYSVIFALNTIETKMCVQNGNAMFFNCVSDRHYKANIGTDQSLVQWGEGCKIKNGPETIKIRYGYDPACFLLKGKLTNNPFDFASLLSGFITMVIILLISSSLLYIYGEIRRNRDEAIDKDVIGDTSSLINSINTFNEIPE